MQLASAGYDIGMGLINNSMGQAMNAQNSKRQVKASKELSDYQYELEMKKWRETGYKAQVQQLKEAGLNPAMMYGMGGGGGQSSAVGSGGGVGAGEGSKGIAAGMGMQLQLLKAQKENIEADTENKRAQAGYTSGPQTGKTEQETRTGKATEGNVLQDTDKKIQETKNVELENIMKDYLMNFNEKGEEVGITGSISVNNEVAEMRKTVAETVFKNDENARQAVINSEQVKKIGAEIALMKRKGATEAQILQNLIKDGTMKDTEIAWQKLGLTKETLGQVVLGLVKAAAK